MYPSLADGLRIQLLGPSSESHRLGGLNNRECVSHSLEARSVRSRCGQSGPSAVSHPSWQTAVFSLHRHRDFCVCVSVPLLLFSHSVVPGSLQPWGLQHARPPCPSPTAGDSSNSPIELVMPSNHLILCRPLLLLPPIFPSIRVFSNELAHCNQVAKVLELQLQHRSAF